MKNLSKQEIEHIGKSVFRPIRFILIIALLAFFSSIFVIIWYDWLLGSKIFISSFIVLVVGKKLKDWTTESIIEEFAKAEEEPRIGKKSKFQERLEEMQRLRDERN